MITLYVRESFKVNYVISNEKFAEVVKQTYIYIYIIHVGITYSAVLWFRVQLFSNKY